MRWPSGKASVCKTDIRGFDSRPHLFFGANIMQQNKDFPSICVITSRFGEKLPHNFELWLHSCRYNPSIDFLFFTDLPVCTKKFPPNVRIVPFTLEQIRQKASDILGFSAVLTEGYHLCNYRPMFGEIFHDYLVNYDYWGHCDNDMVLGDIRSFTEKYHLTDYDKFLPLGHLSLFRNVPAVNQAYQLDGASRMDGTACTYREVYSTNTLSYFDEELGIVSIMRKHHFKVFMKRIFADILPFYYRFIRAPHNYSSLEPLPKNYTRQTFYWEKGKVFGVHEEKGKIYQEEFVYLHFQKRPDRPLPFDAASINAFYITPSGYLAKTGEVSLQDIISTNPYSWHKEIRDYAAYLRRNKIPQWFNKLRLVHYMRKMKKKFIK